MQNVADKDMAAHFLAWQCRLRQIAMREHGGRPGPGMAPQVTLPSGEVVLPAMAVLLLPKKPEETTTLFEFQARKSNDPRQVYEAGLKFLQADYYHKPKRFKDRLLAVFPGQSHAAGRLTAADHCLLTFDQFSQVWILPCKAKALNAKHAARRHALSHNRLFNPATPGDATVLAFKPDWGKAQAQPMPPGVG